MLPFMLLSFVFPLVVIAVLTGPDRPATASVGTVRRAHVGAVLGAGGSPDMGVARRAPGLPRPGAAAWRRGDGGPG